MNKTTSLRALLALALCAATFVSFAEEPNANAAPVSNQVDPVRIDRDGQTICGFDLMSDSERGGYRNMMHQTKAREDRDAIRVDHCARMKIRAKERKATAEE